MSKKLEIEFLELEALADVLEIKYQSLRNSISKKLQSNEALEFGKNGRYKLFGRPNKVWYAYDSEKYEITIKTAPPKADA